MSSIYDWALDAPSNANSDNIINWQEGQPPSSVNNSARAMMQRIAEYISDNSAIMAGGTSAAITGTIKSPITKLRSGQSIKLIATVANIEKATLNINSTGSKPIYKNGEKAVIQLTGSEMVPNGVYSMTYIEALNGGTGGWFLDSPTAQPHIPSGIISAFATMSAPAGWLECNGRAISRTDYKELFQVIGTKWGEGDKTTTFNIPDLRGEFIRGWDNGRGIDSGRNFASFQDSDNKSHSHSADCGKAGAHSHNYTVLDFAYPGPNGTNSWSWFKWITKKTDVNGDHSHNISIGSSGGIETRPRNIAIMYAIKT